ncbi:permease prefix domain 1-containing protein [Actinopolymorpha alba]|uniref:permease prefix domain 1-containing protein n=1 Tax=Actinopolymorpha alba TaxID=533267 RepID=UPI00037417F9|nr:permease prefix domain 1-containing protein [Actinopolymorpha alba]
MTFVVRRPGPYSPIADYLRELERALPGPRTVRRDLLGELADGLHDAVEAHTRAGLSTHQAEVRAVEASGQVAELASAYRTELAVAQSRRTARLFALSMPSLVLAWTAVWTRNFPTSSSAAGGPPHMELLSSLTDWIGLVGGGSALCVLALLTWVARMNVPVRAILVGQVVVGGTAVTVSSVASVAMNVLNSEQVLRVVMSSPPLFALGIVSTALSVWKVHSLWLTSRTAFCRRPLGRSGALQPARPG